MTADAASRGKGMEIPDALRLLERLDLTGKIAAARDGRAATLRGLQNDIYMQIGLLTTMGLAAKNAILMIEFAEQARISRDREAGSQPVRTNQRGLCHGQENRFSDQASRAV